MLCFCEARVCTGNVDEGKTDISLRIDFNVNYGIYGLTVIFRQKCLDLECAAERTE